MVKIGIRQLVIALLAVLLTLAIATTALSVSDRCHVGYVYYGYKGRKMYGVAGYIYTINAAVPPREGYCEWVTTILSYNPLYWIQVGYYKGYDTNYVLRYYIEKNDRFGYYNQYLDIGPSAKSSHHYIIAYAFDNNDPNKWVIEIDHGNTYFQFIYVTPYDAYDVQAFVETSSSSISVSGSHFYDLQYSNGYAWKLWDRHVAYADSPYKIVEISHHEFKAYGGGR